MKSVTGERLAAAICLLPGLGAVVWTGTAVAFPWLAAGSALASLAAAAGLLVWLAGGEDTPAERLVPWVLGLAAAAVVGVGSATDYNLWFADSRLWTAGCYTVALAAVAVGGLQRGWVGGLRAALVALLASTPALLAIFRVHVGMREQPAVFQAAGLLDAYQSSGSGEFTPWIIKSFLAGVLPRTVAALACGAALGAVVGWLARRTGR